MWVSLSLWFVGQVDLTKVLRKLSIRVTWPRLTYSTEELSLSPGDWSASFFWGGNADRARGIFGDAWLRPCFRTHLKKALCCPGAFGGVLDKYWVSLAQLCRPRCSGRQNTVQFVCVSGLLVKTRKAQHSRYAAETLILIEAKEAVRRTLICFGRARFIVWRLRRPIFREIPTGPKAFLEPPGISGLWPCARFPTLKRSCATIYLGGILNKYRVSLTQLFCWAIKCLFIVMYYGVLLFFPVP